MGYSICGADEDKDQSLNICSWRALLILAYSFGWKPKGTVFYCWQVNKTGEKIHPLYVDENRKDGGWVKDGDWSGTYFTNDWQEITAEDAHNLAKALKRALLIIPDEGVNAPELPQGCRESSDDEIHALLDNREYLISFWSGLAGKQKIGDCIELFKSGSCNIA